MVKNWFSEQDAPELRSPTGAVEHYTHELIDLSERPRPVRPGCGAPMLLYGDDNVSIGWLEEDGWHVQSNVWFEPKFARFIPNVDYRQKFG